MEQKALILEAELEKVVIVQELNKVIKNLDHSAVLVVDDAPKIEVQDLKPVFMEIERQYVKQLDLTIFGNEKPFICKGKHQYKEVKGEWICQCGRNIKD